MKCPIYFLAPSVTEYMLILFGKKVTISVTEDANAAN